MKSVRYSCVGRFFSYAILALALASCHRPAQTVSFFGEAQGTYYSIKYVDPLGRDLQPQVDSLLHAFDLEASLWEDSSLLRRLNANQTDSLSPILSDLLRKAQEMNAYTNGAFDCRVGRIVQAWGFSFRTRQEPDSLALDSLLRQARGGIRLEDRRLVKEYAGTELDFNAIAQGYSVDLIAQMFARLGLEDYIIDVGGEVIAHGEKPDGSPWRVGIERPAADSTSGREVQSIIALRNASVVTSGNYRKYYERDGVRYSHTIDPRTGRPVRHTLLSASVVDSASWLADAMATAYMVMGLDSALLFIADHPDGPGTGAVMFIYDDHGTVRTHTTPQFEAMQIK